MVFAVVPLDLEDGGYDESSVWKIGKKIFQA
jgi:hypothetical protein